MGPINIKKITAILIIGMALFGKSFAQDMITFTWQADGKKVVKISATLFEDFTIDWDDGSPIQTRYCDSPYSSCFLYHVYPKEGTYTVTITASNTACRFLFFDCAGVDYSGLTPPKNKQISNLVLTNCSALKDLKCYNNLLTKLDLSDCSALTYLDCSQNLLETLDLTMCSGLKNLWCHYNRLQLTILFEIDLLLDGKWRYLGRQNLLPQTADVGEELFAQQSVLDGIFTKYVVTKNGNLAPEGAYTVVDGKLTFNSEGVYIVTMTNDAITSHSDYPVEVIATIYVGNVGISENSPSKIKFYPNPTSDYIFIESGNIPEIKLYSLDGRLLQNSHSKIVDLSTYAKGIYLLSINGKTQKIIKK